MTEDEFQQVRYPDHDRDRILLCLVAALARLPAVEALGDVLEFLSRFAGLHGWRLSDLSAGGPAGDEAALRAAVDAIVGPLGRWKGPHGTEADRLAREFAALRAAWRALLARFAAHGLDVPAQLAARAAAVGVAALPYRWTPPPVLLPHDDPPFTVQFSGPGALHLLTTQDRGCVGLAAGDGESGGGLGETADAITAANFSFDAVQFTGSQVARTTVRSEQRGCAPRSIEPRS